MITVIQPEKSFAFFLISFSYAEIAVDLSEVLTNKRRTKENQSEREQKMIDKWTQNKRI